MTTVYKPESQTPSIPRKGTETRCLMKLQWPGLTRQTPSIPRKGTETAPSTVAVPSAFPSDTLNSPQGDGNLHGLNPVQFVIL